ncbi:MAG: VCBS repeat-containing protein [Candidatus Hydrogenedentes bacterium]|nr:VCBS repeat-containing protein [Candidatus Hydrogenedentota bacterium]
MKPLLFSIGILLIGAAAAGPETFTRHPRSYQVGPNPSAIAAGDLNGDGWPEIITCDIGNLSSPRDERPANDELSFLVAQGDLLYISQPPLRAGFAPYSVVIANIDALKALDIVVGSFLASNKQAVTLFRNIGENLFEPDQFAIPSDGLPYTKQRDADDQPVFAKPGITSIAIADFSHDGFRDVIATAWSCDSLVYLPGNDKTHFGEPKFFPAAGGPRDIAAADLDGDGKLDVVTTMYSSGTVAIWKGDGAGGFTEVNHFSSRGNLPHKIRIADVNGDDKPDLIVSHCSADDSIVIFYGEGGVDFPLSQEIHLGKDHRSIEHEIRDILVEDFNGDKRKDIAAACFASNQVILLTNDSPNAGIPQQFERESYPFKEGHPRALCAADFDKSGRADLGVALWGTNSVALLLAKSPIESKAAPATTSAKKREKTSH